MEIYINAYGGLTTAYYVLLVILSPLTDPMEGFDFFRITAFVLLAANVAVCIFGAAKKCLYKGIVLGNLICAVPFAFICLLFADSFRGIGESAETDSKLLFPWLIYAVISVAEFVIYALIVRIKKRKNV
ncbi:MAG: hypothetical protein J5994_02820 [Ruminococcus sp.]|nr:hypothetical protein [Ruminococcus sp.]